MNAWYSSLIQFGLLAVGAAGAIISAVWLSLRCIRKQKKKAAALSLAFSLLLFCAVWVFTLSHGTYYKYNDWRIVGQSIHAVEEKYGEFDLGAVTEHTAGWAAYYIYTDNGPVMPDYLEHYYYMEYDEHGVVYRVYGGCQPGG